MNFSEEQLAQSRAYGNLVEKCWADAEFKQSLIQKPNAVLDYIDYKIPAGKKFAVLDQTNGVKTDRNTLDSDTAYFVIPEQIDIDSLELSDEHLSMVAGGLPHATIALLSASSVACSVVASIVGIGIGIWSTWD